MQLNDSLVARALWNGVAVEIVTYVPCAVLRSAVWLGHSQASGKLNPNFVFSASTVSGVNLVVLSLAAIEIIEDFLKLQPDIP